MTTTWAQRRKDRIDDLAGGRSLTAEAFRRLRRDPIAITGAVIVGAFVVIAILSPLIAPHSATEPFPQLQRDGEYVIRGTRLDGELWEVESAPL